MLAPPAQPGAVGPRLGRAAPKGHDRSVDDLTRLALDAGAGDQAALARLVRSTQAEVWRLCAHLVDVRAADDLAQETYLRAVGALPRFRGDSSARTWLLVIARRTCADEVRRRVRRRRLEGRIEQEARAARSEGGDTSSASVVDDLVAALEPDRRAAFVLTQLLGLSYAEAAQVCDCKVGTIRSRVSRARGDLMAMLDTEGTAGEVRPA
jgi:RNA polymerase sigma-70 factor (ECF subfamily)